MSQKGLLFAALTVLFAMHAFSQNQVSSWLTTNDRSSLLAPQPGLAVSSWNAPMDTNVVMVDPNRTYQTVDGFGFALTGGSAELMMKMSAGARARLLSRLFGPGGAGISYLRVSIGSSDMNDHVFTYDDMPDGQSDAPLAHFSLGEDLRDVIPVLREILAINPSIKILGSPWSAPSWMKTNHEPKGGSLLPAYYKVYADYFVRYIQGMRQHGIPIDAITIQNEPFNEGNTPSMVVLAGEAARFIREDLGPAFKTAGIHTKIVLWDHNCDDPEYPISILNDPGAAAYVAGSGFHLYSGPVTAMSTVHDAFPRKDLYFTEQMVVNHGHFNISGPVEHIVIGALRNWSRNVLLWNLAADPEFKPHTDDGGCPVCQGAITIAGDSVELNTAYYTIAQVSKFVPAGSVRLESQGPLASVAFRRPDGKIVVVVANNRVSREFPLVWGDASVKASLPAHSVGVFVIDPSFHGPVVRVASGLLQGRVTEKGIRTFKGVPFAQPPVGPLRWAAPAAPLSWTGIRQADHFGPQAMQRRVYSDMIFRSFGMSEDCLYLNVWAPASGSRLPVLVYFYGGGFAAGDGSEPRYDGESMATKGIVTVTVNYRLGVFGFMALPSGTSGNYGLMDQHAALLWVRKNIAAFGGDPDKVTIAGESAGSMSVCAQMASPLSAGLFRAAIGESGSVLGNLSPQPLAAAEANGQRFMESVGATSLDELRRIPAASLLDAAAHTHFGVTVDGHFLTEAPVETFATGKQMDVYLLAGWNSAETDYHGVFGGADPTADNYTAAVQKIYGDKAPLILEAYPATLGVRQVATDLAADRFIAYATWKWLNLNTKTTGKSTYRYLFAQKPPGRESMGAPHASDIPYCLGNLPLIKTSDWTQDDYKASEVMQTYFVNFIKTCDPNATGLPVWLRLQMGKPELMVIDAHPRSEQLPDEERYLLLDTLH